ncbi:hypothetical protein bcere0012_20450 [Bacillus cereus BDRD-ST24]|nr:hypothetical protein bcere0012_20450 [Bacillus cereus BDRD-ST24]
MYLPIIKKIPSFLAIFGHVFNMLIEMHFQFGIYLLSYSHMYCFTLRNSRKHQHLFMKTYLLSIFNFPFIKSFFLHNRFLASHIVLMMTKEECSCLNLKSKNMDKKLHNTNNSHVTISFVILKNI